MCGCCSSSTSCSGGRGISEKTHNFFCKNENFDDNEDGEQRTRGGRGTNGKDACRGDDGHTDDVVDLTWKPSPRSLVSGISPEISGSGPGVSGTANGICDDDDEDHECDNGDEDEGGVDDEDKAQ